MREADGSVEPADRGADGFGGPTERGAPDGTRRARRHPSELTESTLRPHTSHKMHIHPLPALDCRAYNFP